MFVINTKLFLPICNVASYIKDSDKHTKRGPFAKKKRKNDKQLYILLSIPRAFILSIFFPDY